jgi:prolyl 4-hydroxylase
VILADTIAAMNHADLRHYIRTYERALEPALCARRLASFSGLERFQRPNGRGIRAGLEESAWMELNVTKMADEGFRGMFRRMIDGALALYNTDVGLSIAVPNSPLTSDLIMKRYRPGVREQFQLHFDAIHHVAHRYLVLLWYLNDVAEGGETRFPQLGHAVSARAGTLLMFPPYWMYQHEGAPPRSGDKYILSTYLLFTTGPNSSTAAGMAAE